jgi:hypothetical protein
MKHLYSRWQKHSVEHVITTPIPVQNKRDFLKPLEIFHIQKKYFYYKKISIFIKKE